MHAVEEKIRTMLSSLEKLHEVGILTTGVIVSSIDTSIPTAVRGSCKSRRKGWRRCAILFAW